MRRLSGVFAAAAMLFAVLAQTEAVSAGQAQDAAALSAAFARADARDHDVAAHEAARAGDGLVAELAAWRRLLDGQGSFEEMRRMLAARADWPRMTQLRREAERAMPLRLPAETVMAFFAGAEPLTGAGALALAEAQGALGHHAAAEATLAQAWRALSLTGEERAAFERRHGALVRALAVERLDAMLWAGDEAQARAVFPLVDAGWRALAEARLALRARDNGVDARIAAVPQNLSNDAGLAYERFVWRARADRTAEAEQLLMQRTGSARALGRPEAWAGRRAGLARAAFRDGRVAEAYRLASQHHLDAGSAFADLEWLSGWIALRGLYDPQRAAGHFLRMYNAVETPISKGRGGYWLGLAYAQAGDKARSQEWLRRAADHPTSFYGQLAAERIGRDVRPDLAAHDADKDWRRASFAKSDTLRAIALLQAAGREAEVRQFLTALSRSFTARDDFAALGRFALEIGRPDGAVVVGKQAARAGHVIMDIYYPVESRVGSGGPIEPALALAIARQESEMNPAAISPAGARGLMQLMPRTAQKVSRDLGVRYALDKLTDDPAYNVKLGKAYLAEMLAQFGGAKMLAAAAYNAGPNRADQWVGSLGDPRHAMDPVDWIEHIPFTETRNYVQRVMEGLHVYRARLGADAAASYTAALTRPQG